MYVAQPIEWTDRGVVMLDQRRLPSQEIHHTYTDYRDVAKAIRDMVIRGAPAIGVAAAMGAALGVLHSSGQIARGTPLGVRRNLRSPGQDTPDSRRSFLGARSHEGAFRRARLAKFGPGHDSKTEWSQRPSWFISKRKQRTKPSADSALS